MISFQKKMKKAVVLFAVFSLFSAGSLPANPVWAKDSQVQEKDLSVGSSTETASLSNDEVSSETPKKGGIYKVGRAFKTAGGGMKKGFVVTGRAFKKVGSSIKNFFTGGGSEEKPVGSGGNSEKQSSSKLDHVGDEPETRPAS